MRPEIEFFTVFAVTDNRQGTVTVLEEPIAQRAAE
jgi:hypothetical protein